MKRRTTCWVLAFVILFVFLFIHCRFSNINSISNTETIKSTQQNYIHICTLTEETNSLEIQTVVLAIILSLTILYFFTEQVHNVKHTHHRKKHIKHLPRADISNAGIII